MIKYSLWYKNYSVIRYNMRAADILTFDKCLYLRGRLRLTTARRLSAYMSSRALATNTASSLLLNSYDGNDAKQRVFLGRLLVALKRAGFNLADVQRDAILPSCLHVTAFSIDQLLCR